MSQATAADRRNFFTTFNVVAGIISLGNGNPSKPRGFLDQVPVPSDPLDPVSPGVRPIGTEQGIVVQYQSKGFRGFWLGRARQRPGCQEK